MKKFLFTLCAVLVGFAASADGVQLQLVDNNGNPVSEVHAKAGDQINLHLKLTAMDGVCTGWQMQYVMKDSQGNPIDVDNGPVVVQKVGGNYLRSEGMSKLVGNGNGNTTPEPGTYRALLANTGMNIVWTTDPQVIADILDDDVENLFDSDIYDPVYTQSMFNLGNVIAIRIKVNTGWTDDYAMFDFDEVFTKFSGFENQQIADEGMSLKIINDDATPALQDLTGNIVISEPDENGQVTVTYTGNENVTITVNGEEYTGPIQLQDGVPTEIAVTVTAEGYNPLTATETRTWTAPVTANEPTIEIVESADYLTMTVTVTAEEGCTLIVNGEAINSNTYTYTVNRATDIYTADDPVVVTAKAVKDLASGEVTSSKAWTVVNKPTADTPVINFIETKNGEVVTAVDVEILNYTEYNINGEPYTRATVAHYDANYVADQEITVNAKNDPGYPYEPAVATATYTLKKLEKADVAAPVITTTMDDNNVYVNIEWPESDGEHVYNGQYTYPRGTEDASYPVEAYVAEGATCNESAHATATIVVPKKETTPEPPTEKTAEPTFNGSTTDGIHAYNVAIADVDPEAVIYYRVYKDNVLITATDENPEGWLTYEEVLSFTQDGSYRVEAYAEAPGKLPSDAIGYEFNVTETTGLVDVLNGKTVANVRYFNMAGQEMQEANGMTIVVTTYTDGTTNSVKVLK